MRLQELFLVETTEEDRALISLSSAIYAKVQKYIGELDYETVFDVPEKQLIRVGRIGDMFNTPIQSFDDITIEIQGGEPFLRRADDVPDEDAVDSGRTVLAFWEEDTKTVVLNLEMLDRNRMKTVITHELRHALDDVKSNQSSRDSYFTPKKKEHRDVHSSLQYRAQPAEINARFVELLDIMSKRIPQWYNKVDASEIKGKLSNDFKHLLVKFDIADLFPEKAQSRDYKRLVKRGYDFMQKEMMHIETEMKKADTPKSATGNW